nr:MAG TPA: ETC complex I subunit conserved region [Caudoviricetes sp.]
MLPEDLDYHTDEDGNILCFDNLDELMNYCNKNGIVLDKLAVFTIPAEEEI